MCEPNRVDLGFILFPKLSNLTSPPGKEFSVGLLAEIFPVREGQALLPLSLKSLVQMGLICSADVGGGGCFTLSIYLFLYNYYFI